MANPTSEQLLSGLEKAHLAGDTAAAKELAVWHNELYGNAQQEQATEPAQQQAIPTSQEVDGYTGADYKQPKVPAINSLRGAGERAGDLASGLATTIKTAASSAEEMLPLGGFVWQEGDVLPTYLTGQQYSQFKQDGGSELISVASDKAKNIDLGYVPDNTWESVKQEFSEGGPLSGSAWGEVLAYGAEQGIQSIPDMAAVMLSLPAYVVARSGEMGETRAANKGKEAADITDVMEAAPFALGSALLERIGAKGMTQAATEAVGKDAIKAGIASVAARIGTEAGKAGSKEAATEAVQEGIIEYAGERFGTDAAMSMREAFDNALAGAVAGGVYGGAAGGVSQSVGETVNSPQAQAQREINNNLSRGFAESARQVAAQSLSPENAQVEARPSMAELIAGQLQERGIDPAQAFGLTTKFSPQPAPMPEVANMDIPLEQPVDIQTLDEPVAPITTTANDQATQPKKTRFEAAMQVDTSKDSLLVAAAKSGGLNREAWEAEGIDPATFKDSGINNRVFGRPSFRKGSGMTPDQLAELASQLGYGNNITANQAVDLINRELKGDAVYTPVGMERQIELQAERMAEDEAAKSIDYNPDEYSEFTAEMSPEQEAAFHAAVAFDKNIDEIPFGDDGYASTYDELEFKFDEMMGALNANKQKRVDEKSQGSAAKAPFELGQETEAERQKREKLTEAKNKEDKKKKQQQQQKAQADTDANDFVLAGSDSVSDQAAARGQKDIFAVSKPPAKNDDEDQILADIKQQLIDTGRYTKAEAAEYAKFLPVWAKAKAKRDGITIAQAYKKAALKIEGPDGKTKRSGKALAQSNVTTINQLSDEIKQIDGVKTIFISESRGKIKLDSIIIDNGKRGSGVGTKAMNMIVDYADKNNKVIALSPALKDDYQGTTSRSRLVKFYKQFGFVENKGRKKDFSISESMYREPKEYFDHSDPNILKQFAGEVSATADIESLDLARSRIKAGDSSESVRRNTGWFIGADGRWRYEISDDQSAMSENWKELIDYGAPYLSDMLNHPVLYEAYPFLKSFSVHPIKDDGVLGELRYRTRQIFVDTSMTVGEVHSTLLHEVQHAIQEIEDFGRGGHADKVFSDSVKSALAEMAEFEKNKEIRMEWMNADLVENAKRSSDVARDALKYKSALKLTEYSKMDKPSSLFSRIRNNVQWIYAEEFYGNPEAREIERMFYAIPKRGPKRNDAIAKIALSSARLIAKSISMENYAKFENDKRTVDGMIKAFEREADRSRVKLKPLQDQKERARAASSVYENSRMKSYYQIYRALAGEIEARTTQNRQFLNDEERQRIQPEIDMDIDSREAIVILGGMQISIPTVRKQITDKKVRGYYDPENNIIRLTEASDRSTFLHEFAHFMYEQEVKENTAMNNEINSWFMRNAKDIASEAGATEADVKRYIGKGTSDNKDTDANIRRAQHEQFARGFEVYVMEGKAPTEALRRTFRKLAKWLIQVYAQVRGNLNVKLDADMRKIYDRLLSTEGERMGQTPSEIKKGDDVAALIQSQADNLSSDTPMPNWRPMYRDGGINKRAPDDKFKIGSRIVKLKPEDKPTRREGVRVMVQSIIGPRIYDSKIRSKSTLGFYKRSNSEVRIARYDDVEVMAHEMAHFLDLHYKFNDRFSKSYNKEEFQDEVADLSYTSNENVVMTEGFAEFVRLWLTNYSEAQDAAPLFTAEFEKILSKDQILNDKMKALQEEMHRWYRQGARAQAEAMMSGNQYTVSQKIQKTMLGLPLELARQRYIDKIHAAKIMERTTNGDLLDATESAYKQLQLLNGTDGIVSQSYYNGAPSFNDEGTLVMVGPSLNDVWKQSAKAGKQRIRDQELYFVARRARELKRRGISTQFDGEIIAKGIALGSKHSYFKKAFSDYQEYRANMFDFFVDTGYISRDAASKMMDSNKNYVPFMRDIEKGGKKAAGGSGFNRIKGSLRNLKPVMDTMMVQDSQHIAAALKARAMKALYTSALNSQEGSLFISKLAPDSRPADKQIVDQVMQTYTSVLDRAVKEDGIIITDANGNELTPEQLAEDYALDEMKFFSHGHKPKTTDTMVDSFIDDSGKTVWIEIQNNNRILADMIDSMEPGALALPDGPLGALMSAAFKAKQLVTLTITSAYQFMLPNVVRDQQQAFIVSGAKYKPGLDMIKGMGELMKSMFSKDTAYWQMVQQGGPSGGKVRQQFEESTDRGLSKADVLPLYYPVKFMNSLLDSYLAIMDSAEMSTRVGFYKRLINEGKSPREAAWQAREISTDFAKHGSYNAFVMLQRTIPFFGAYVQSVDRDLRAFAEQNGEMSFANLVKTESGRATLDDLKVRIWIASSIMVSIPIILALINDDEDEYERLTPDEKTRFYHFWKDGEHYTVPKPHGFVSAAGLAGETIVDYVKGSATSKEAADNLLFGLAYHFGFSAGPALTQPFYEIAKNEDWRGAPVISRGLESVMPQYQYTDRTPLIYVKAGEKLGVSPDMTKHIVDGYLGYFSDYISETGDSYLWDSEAWGERPFPRSAAYLASKQFVPNKVAYRTKWTEGYYELKLKAMKAKATMDALQKVAIRDQAPLKQFTADKTNQTLTAINKAFSEIDRSFKDEKTIMAGIKYNKKLSREEKEQKIEAWYKAKNDVLAKFYKQAESALNTIEIP